MLTISRLNQIWSAANLLLFLSFIFWISTPKKQDDDFVLGPRRPLPACPELGRLGKGGYSGAVLRTPQSAKIVGKEYLSAISTDIDYRDFHGRVGVEDDGDSWMVFTLQEKGVYGGDVFVVLNKCSGSIVRLGMEPD